MLDVNKIAKSVNYWKSRGLDAELLDMYALHNKAVFSKSFKYLYESANENWSEYFKIVSSIVGMK